MKARAAYWHGQTSLTRFDRIALHWRCLLRDHKYRWHLAGIWREISGH
jgi:hypothetical protein